MGGQWLAAILACSVVLPYALGLRVTGPAENVTRDPSTIGLKQKRHSGPSELENFRSKWTRLYNTDMESNHIRDPLPASIKMVLGVMTVPQDSEYRQVLRATWMKQTGVCLWNKGEREGCSVYVAFVMGKHGMGTDRHGNPYGSKEISEKELEKAHAEAGALVLDMEENMNEGKTFTWFSTALTKISWATHVGKMDIDTYPYLHNLLPGIGDCADKTTPFEYMGRPGCSGTFCDKTQLFNNACPAVEGCTHNIRHGGTAKWEFMSGALYILSMPLIKRIAWDAVEHVGPEDRLVGKTINTAAFNQSFCVAVRTVNDWWHSWP
uniref:Hexosyltransferase n=1 Tax=Alexandrium catenella TaxID=2925 RepID=A0A7S1L521_ALECA|mmetsp:Transcript_106705/g.283842  ORF Transcript_106705/g.283842 Transcript_106705/m.283842 type:complete len:322 (+) Transcript_106705:47-1012(+)